MYDPSQILLALHLSPDPAANSKASFVQVVAWVGSPPGFSPPTQEVWQTSSSRGDMRNSGGLSGMWWVSTWEFYQNPRPRVQDSRLSYLQIFTGPMPSHNLEKEGKRGQAPALKGTLLSALIVFLPGQKDMLCFPRL